MARRESLLGGSLRRPGSYAEAFVYRPRREEGSSSGRAPFGRGPLHAPELRSGVSRDTARTVFDAVAVAPGEPERCVSVRSGCRRQDREGAVIDERNNGGGSAADYIIEVLSRELTGYFNSRAGDRLPFKQPIAGLYGPKAMIINERAGSGGDLLPYLFRFKKLGPLIGTRTWGGLVGTWDTPRLIDGGRFVAPRGGFFDIDGNWAVEAEGVAPDVEVRNDPRPVIEGRDPQLEAAVKNVL